MRRIATHLLTGVVASRTPNSFLIRVIRVIRGYAFSDEPVFNFLSCPGRFTQERKTGLDARIELETPDRDAPPHLAPTMPLDKLIENVLQRDAVQGIAGMGFEPAWEVAKRICQRQRP